MRILRFTTHRPRVGRGRPPKSAGRGLDPKRFRPCAGLLSGVTAGASVAWLSSEVASDSEAAAAASSCLEAVSVDAADASSLFSGVVAGEDSSFSSGFSSSSTFLCPGLWRVNGARGLGPRLVRPNKAPELGRAPALLGAAVVEDAAAVLDALVLGDFPPKRLLPPKRFLPLLADAAVVVVGSASAGDDVLSSSSGSSSFWCLEWSGDGRRPNCSLPDDDRGVGRLRRSPPSSLRVDDVAGVVVVVEVV